ncbi:hypothetical protein HYH02_009516 [Chlamydomonas schloesseri]|uniref:Uncharacterized protein n=1 Tax=Chlamydomonas schloesseri TaxID=2026947 RepID=A0A835TG33_9CHLO|nr:hypothetical protein HYH02_009516 [Chlamydomonas schloesseri]|eukprot:KAG2443102.1 hypothetical protein HYH02_009516 [Chlamydomonas schloesseri]
MVAAADGAAAPTGRRSTDDDGLGDDYSVISQSAAASGGGAVLEVGRRKLQRALERGRLAETVAQDPLLPAGSAAYYCLFKLTEPCAAGVRAAAADLEPAGHHDNSSNGDAAAVAAASAPAAAVAGLQQLLEHPQLGMLVDVEPLLRQAAQVVGRVERPEVLAAALDMFGLLEAAVTAAGGPSAVSLERVRRRCHELVARGAACAAAPANSTALDSLRQQRQGLALALATLRFFNSPLAGLPRLPMEQRAELAAHATALLRGHVSASDGAVATAAAGSALVAMDQAGGSSTQGGGSRPPATPRLRSLSSGSVEGCVELLQRLLQLDSSPQLEAGAVPAPGGGGGGSATESAIEAGCMPILCALLQWEAGRSSGGSDDTRAPAAEGLPSVQHQALWCLSDINSSYSHGAAAAAPSAPSAAQLKLLEADGIAALLPLMRVGPAARRVLPLLLWVAEAGPTAQAQVAAALADACAQCPETQLHFAGAAGAMASTLMQQQQLKFSDTLQLLLELAAAVVEGQSSAAVGLLLPDWGGRPLVEAALACLDLLLARCGPRPLSSLPADPTALMCALLRLGASCEEGPEGVLVLGCLQACVGGLPPHDAARFMAEAVGSEALTRIAGLVSAAVGRKAMSDGNSDGDSGGTAADRGLLQLAACVLDAAWPTADGGSAAFEQLAAALLDWPCTRTLLAAARGPQPPMAAGGAHASAIAAPQDAAAGAADTAGLVLRAWHAAVGVALLSGLNEQQRARAAEQDRAGFTAFAVAFAGGLLTLPAASNTGTPSSATTLAVAGKAWLLASAADALRPLAPHLTRQQLAALVRALILRTAGSSGYGPLPAGCRLPVLLCLAACADRPDVRGQDWPRLEPSGEELLCDSMSETLACQAATRGGGHVLLSLAGRVCARLGDEPGLTGQQDSSSSSRPNVRRLPALRLAAATLQAALRQDEPAAGPLQTPGCRSGAATAAPEPESLVRLATCLEAVCSGPLVRAFGSPPAWCRAGNSACLQGQQKEEEEEDRAELAEQELLRVVAQAVHQAHAALAQRLESPLLPAAASSSACGAAVQGAVNYPAAGLLLRATLCGGRWSGNFAQMLQEMHVDEAARLRSAADAPQQAPEAKQQLQAQLRKAEQQVVRLRRKAETEKESLSKELDRLRDHIEVDFMAACAAGDIVRVKQVVQQGAVDINKLRAGESGLLKAVKAGRAHVVSYLLSVGADANVPGGVLSPLLFAASNNNKSIVKALVAAGANKNVRNLDRKRPKDLATDHEVRALLLKGRAPD